VEIGSGLTSIHLQVFYGCGNLNKITCYSTKAPSIANSTFTGVKPNGILYIPSGSDYSSWMGTGNYYLGKYNWTTQTIAS
jgi:hypothetical protein